MKSQDIRSSFLKYFADRGHRIVPSSSLIPHDDPTLLFANAGMNQFKATFLGIEQRDYKRATSSQKCLRAGGKHNDLENVGFTARHQTFFEMLGNFSFGDYFKAEAIAFAWEYVIKYLGLDPKRLYATVYKEDDEAERLWKKIAPELRDRVYRFGEKDNYWSMGDTGPCGPCSEIHYDRGERYPGELNGEGDRFMEVWNLVFMQFNRDASGTLTPLPKPSVDTGAGLERFSMVTQNVETNYETDLFMPIINRIAEISGVEYSAGSHRGSHRVIADHLRALTFAIADSGPISISNEGRGYVLRRILRRAARHGRQLGLHEPFLFKAVQPLVDIMGHHYPEIKAKQKHIELVISSEEEQFGRTLDTGLEIFEDIIKKVASSGSKTIAGDDIFRLYDTYGFPVDLTEVMARERGMHADMEGFVKELNQQRDRAKASGKFDFVMVEDDNFLETLDIGRRKSEFVGYTTEFTQTTMLYGDRKRAYIEKTPFYAESGGQVGDTGVIESDRLRFIVEKTAKSGENIIQFGHFDFIDDSLNPDSIYNEPVDALIDSDRRRDIKRNHTATHLLHKALRMTLGEHVHQAGSLVNDEKLRFDFTHFKAMTPDEIDKVEDIVNQKIKEDLVVTPLDKSLEEAKAMGAMALFGEKYGERVRVIKTGDFSLELCGGTHVDNTSDIQICFVKEETAIAAGMRRIEAITGREASKYLAEQKSYIDETKKLMAKSPEALSESERARFKELSNLIHRRIIHRENLQNTIADFLKKIESLRKQTRKQSQDSLVNEAINLEPTARCNNGKLLIFKVPASDTQSLMIYSDSFRQKFPQSAIFSVSELNGSFALASPDESFGQTVFKEITAISGARGGGKPTIRGTMPVDKIDLVIDGLKGKFS